MTVKRILTLGLAALAVICMAPNRRAHDHIGNFNFTIEVDGVAVGQFDSEDGLDAVLRAAGTPKIATQRVDFDDGRLANPMSPTQGQVFVYFTLVEPTEGLPEGYTCALNFAGRVAQTGPDSVSVKPTSAARSNCR